MGGGKRMETEDKQEKEVRRLNSQALPSFEKVAALLCTCFLIQATRRELGLPLSSPTQGFMFPS